ncbi:hypothetical protein VNO77_18754 [Canavalia gladiata]|uniref:RNA helicase n=1 Tax=Canavalia gladiata TaxID=3824 RepID=A0AAN9LPV4_CANGL
MAPSAVCFHSSFSKVAEEALMLPSLRLFRRKSSSREAYKCVISSRLGRCLLVLAAKLVDDISSLKEKLLMHTILGDPKRVLLPICHGSMASSKQRLLFEEPKDGVRKIVMATNIAETSITINDVVFVLDCEKAKETSYDALVRFCYKEEEELSLEILAIQNAIEYLKIIGALDENENLIILGRYLIVLSMEPKLGQMLILAAIFNFLDPILTVVASLSAAKSQFCSAYSDHLALVSAFEGWKDVEIDLGGYEYYWKNFISSQSMKAIDAFLGEFICLLNDIRFVFGRQVLKPSKPFMIALHPMLLSRMESGPGGDNSKSRLLTLLTRAGYVSPIYKTKQLKKN